MTNRIELIYLPVDKLMRMQGNPRKLKDYGAIDKLRLLIREHGFQNPLQVYALENGKYEIICGNHRYEAAMMERIEELPCIIYTGDRNKAIARAISDNKSSEWTDWDFPALKDIIVEIDTGEYDIITTGFEQVELEEVFGYVSPHRFSDDDEEKDNMATPDGNYPVMVNLSYAEMQAYKKIKKAAGMNDYELFKTRILEGES